MNKTPLHRLFAYDLWANNRVLGALDVLAPLNASDPLAKLISHIIAAQEIWLARIQGQALSGLTAWPEIDPETWPERLRTLNEPLSVLWMKLLAAMGSIPGEAPPQMIEIDAVGAIASLLEKRSSIP